jgi:hypothetical protein
VLAETRIQFGETRQPIGKESVHKRYLEICLWPRAAPEEDGEGVGLTGKSHRGLAGAEVAGDDGDANRSGGGRGSGNWRRGRLRWELDGEGRAVIVVCHSRRREMRKGKA